jgi:uncharacterized membrane protein
MEEDIREVIKEEILEREIRSIKAAFRGFYVHLVLYCLVNAGFSAYVLITGGYFWPIFPIVFWGAGVICHFSALTFAKRNAEEELNMLKKEK